MSMLSSFDKETGTAKGPVTLNDTNHEIITEVPIHRLRGSKRSAATFIVRRQSNVEILKITSDGQKQIAGSDISFPSHFLAIADPIIETQAWETQASLSDPPIMVDGVEVACSHPKIDKPCSKQLREAIFVLQKNTISVLWLVPGGPESSFYIVRQIHSVPLDGSSPPKSLQIKLRGGREVSALAVTVSFENGSTRDFLLTSYRFESSFR